MFCSPVQNSYCFIMAFVVFQAHLEPSALSARMDDLLWLRVQVNYITKHFYPNSPKTIRAESTTQWQQKCQTNQGPRMTLHKTEADRFNPEQKKSLSTLFLGARRGCCFAMLWWWGMQGCASKRMTKFGRKRGMNCPPLLATIAGDNICKKGETEKDENIFSED